jgi:trans-aconitate methyltransferase
MTYPSIETYLGVGVVSSRRCSVSPQLSGIFRRISSHFDRRNVTSVLDFGCGAGLLCRHIFHSFPPIRIEGVDPSDRMIEQARDNCPWGLFFSGGADSPKLACYDVVVARDAFDTAMCIPETLRKLDAHLYPGGRFIIACLAPACAVHEQVMRTLTELSYRVWFEEFESEPTREERNRLLATIHCLRGTDRELACNRVLRPENHWIISARKRSPEFVKKEDCKPMEQAGTETRREARIT